MNSSLAYKEGPRKELLNGETILIPPRPSIDHNRVASNIYYAFCTFLTNKPCETFSDGVDVHLTENDCVIPDVMIICNKDIIKRNGVYGTPDLIVEVLSPGTAKNDHGYKKDLYEKTGVKEYWIAEPLSRTIETYLLKNGKFVLDDVYTYLYSYEELTEEEKNYKKEIPVSLYDNFKIPVDDIFANLF